MNLDVEERSSRQRYGALPVLLRAWTAALVVVVPFGVAHLPGSSRSWGSALAPERG